MNQPEDMTIEKCRAHYESITVPPHVPVNDFGRTMVNHAYIAGFMAAVLIMKAVKDKQPDKFDAIAAQHELDARNYSFMMTNTQGEG